MSKRLSGGGGNTLFNYFAKTPPTNKKSRPAEDEETPAVTNALPDTPMNKKNTDQNKKRDRPTPDPPKPTAIDEDQMDDSPIKPRKKRIRLVESDDSDTENKANGLSTPKEKISLEKKLQDSFKYEPGQSPQSQTKKKPASNGSTPGPKAGPQEPSSTPEEGNWVHCRLDWLRPDKVRDASKRRPDDPDYDPRTLFVPDDFRKNQTPAHRQWWDMKASHFDCVLFFKVGKFYELYHMDAAVGVNELGFSYMKGDFAHSGFPESAYARMASTLVSKGYKVARVEQTETPDMMQERCKRTGQNSKWDKVVAREICQVTCRGTEVSSLQDSGPPEPTASYMMAVAEEEMHGRCMYGVCFVDTSIGVFHLGQFEDDKHSSRLLTTFAHYPPVLVVYERKSASARTSKLISSHCHSARKESVGQFWPPDKTLKTLAEKYYRTDNDGAWPEGLKPFLHEGDALGLTPAPDSHLAIKALGGCISYLTDALLDIQVLGMSQFESYSPPDVLNRTLSQEKDGWEGGNTMVLDAITLRNLRIVGEEGALYDKLNFCSTPMGKRLLRLWVCAPSCRQETIRERQEAVGILLARQELCQDARVLLQKQPDLERLLAKMHTLGNLQRSKQHPDARAIFYEEKKYSKKKVQDFLAVIGGFKAARQLSSLFSDVESTLLRRITQIEPDGKFPDYESTLKFFEEAFDHGEAEREGRIEPARGVDTEYDAALSDIADVTDELEDYRKKQEEHFRARVTYVGSDKKRFQLEVSQNAAVRATPSHLLEGARKGYKRFSTPTTKELLAKMITAEEQKTNVLKDLSRRIFEKFSSHYLQWESAVQCIATLDILLSFAEFARQQTGDICLPEVTVCQDDRPYVRIVEGRHPCIPVAGEFIPNDTSLGGSGRSLLLLTGPNMGGKSTLMRQLGLLTVLAHLGSYVPAQECSVSLVDRVFTRLGASDDILSGQSTFLVEMSETAAIVRHATRHSLVLLDELGRGTSTYDGTAIASAVAAELAARACRVVFSTHYHALVEHLRDHPNVLLGHMACMVETEEAVDGDVPEESITFLYKLSAGACPKSYGFNAARLAGVPAAVARRAHAVARTLAREAECARAARDVLRARTAAPLRALLAALKI